MSQAYSDLLVTVWPFQAELYDLIEKTVGLLVYHGAEVNAMAWEFTPQIPVSAVQQPSHLGISARLLCFLGPNLGTAMCLSLQRLGSQRNVRTGSNASIPLIFSQYGMDVFCGNESPDPDSFYVGLFVKAPDLALGVLYRRKSPEDSFPIPEC